MKNPLSAEGLDTTTDVTNYNYGQLKDATDDTSQDGTVIDKNLLADIRTVFMRAVRLTGIPINNIFDTENSSQLFDACFGTTKVPITTFYNGVVGGASASSILKYPVRTWKENGGKTLRIEGWFSGGNTGALDNLFELPDGYNSAVTVNIMAMTDSEDHIEGSISFSAGTVTTNKKISGTLGDVNHYINASIPIEQ